MLKKDIRSELAKLKVDLRYSVFDKKQWSYLFKEIARQKRLFAYFLVLVGFEVIITVLLPIVIKTGVESSYSMVNMSSLLLASAFLLVLVMVFIANGYITLRLSQKISFNFINKLKEDWVRKYVSIEYAKSPNLANGMLMAKIVYHTQLLKMGLERVIFQGVTGVFLYIAIVVAAFFYSSTLFLLFCLAFPLLFLLFGGFYYIGRYYVAREQTINTRIINFVYDALENKRFIVGSNLSEKKVKKFVDLLELDTFFRMRREVWIRFSSRLLIAMIILTGGFMYLFLSVYPVLNFASWVEVAVSGILIAFFTRVLFQVSSAGLFFEPLNLGLKISLPAFIPAKIKKRRQFSWGGIDRLLIKGLKTKISKFSGLIRRFEFEVRESDRVLIFSQGPYGKSTLAKFICGQKNIKSLSVRYGKDYVKPLAWCSDFSNRCLISLTSDFKGTVGEFLTLKSEEEISLSNIESVISVLRKYEVFDFIFNKNFLGKRMSRDSIGATEMGLLYVAQALLQKYSLICVDHNFFDLENHMLEKGWDILNSELQNSAIIYFSSKQKNSFDYASKYKLTKNSLEKV